MIQRRNALRKILIAYPVDHIQMLSSMKVVEAKPVGLRICCCCCACRLRSGNERECQRSYETDKQGFLEQSRSLFGINSIIVVCANRCRPNGVR